MKTDIENDLDYNRIVKQLIGSIHPVGETNTDNNRMENLKATCELIESLIHDVKALVVLKEHHAYSIKRSGEYAEKFLSELLTVTK